MSCECGRPLETYVVTVDEEQYVEDLCPVCAFPRPEPVAPPDFTRSDPDRQITLEMIDETVAEMLKWGKTPRTLIVSPKTLLTLGEELKSHTGHIGVPTMVISGGCKMNIISSIHNPAGCGVIADTNNDGHVIQPKPPNPFDLLPKTLWIPELEDEDHVVERFNHLKRLTTE